MNKKYFPIFLIISLVVGVISYITLENILISIGILLVYLIVSIFLLIPLLKKYDTKVNHYHECYHFINNFIISLSIKKSFVGAIETTVNSMPAEFVEQYNAIEQTSDKERLDYLSTYFSFYDYQLFLKVIFLWEEQGGDIIEMSKYLTGEIRNNEEYISKCETLTKRKYFEIGTLWLLALAILVFLRFALKDFYTKIKHQTLFIVSVSLIILFILFSIYLLIKKGTLLAIRGYQNNEKNI